MDTLSKSVYWTYMNLVVARENAANHICLAAWK